MKNDNFKKTWEKDIFDKKPIQGFVAVFHNEKTNMFMASQDYTKEVIDDFVEEVLEDAKGALKVYKILPLEDFNEKFKRVKPVNRMSLDFVFPKNK